MMKPCDDAVYLKTLKESLPEPTQPIHTILVNLPLQGQDLTKDHRSILEHLCRHMDVKKNLYGAYDPSFQRPTSSVCLEYPWSVYLTELLSSYARSTGDMKYLNTSLKWVDGQGLKDVPFTLSLKERLRHENP